MAANDGLAHAQARHGKNQNQPLIGQDYRPIGEHYDKYNRMRCEQERSVFTMNCELLKKYKATKTLLDFKKIRVLGTGSFGRVLLVGEKSRFWACKIVAKKRIIETKQVEHTKNEKDILLAMESNFVIDQTEFFMDSKNLYFILEFCNGGEMFTIIQRQRKRCFTPEQTQFFAAQTILAFEYLHNLDIVHRDLKPENMLIDHLGNAKLMDFGFAKRVDDFTYTMCGTPEYLAPEIIAGKGYNRAVDWWAVGVLIFEMRCGRSPFEGGDQLTMFGKIRRVSFTFPRDFTADEQALIGGFLKSDITHRLGFMHGGVTRIQNMRYFKEIDFMRLQKGKMVSPYHPTVRGPGDASNFERFPEEDRKKDMWVPGQDIYEPIFDNF